MSSALSDETEKDVLPWLKLAEELRLLQLDCELNIPQICVMGDQSSGKSSVLEALSGIPFPRGSGLVTRCPIRMVMKRARDGEVWSAKVSTSKNSEAMLATDIEQLSFLIDRKMQDLCQGFNNFSTESVIVELISPDACDLTVVDLPGIIRTVTAGQSTTAIEQVNRLIKSYLMDKRTIILAVIPANQDIATVDILERAQMVDPTGERTLGVLTKIDLIGPGSEDEILQVVNNIRKPLALGYVMLKNRSQLDIMNNISTSQARENEIKFFQTHTIFQKCDTKVYGINQLSKKLTQLLVQRIKQEMIPMKSKVESLLTETRNQLRLLPSNMNIPKTTSERQKLLVSITQEFLRHLNDSIRGEYRDRIMVRNSDLRMYTLVMKKFEIFQQEVSSMAPQFKEEEYIKTLAQKIEQLRGRELPGFMSSQAFYMCMSSYVDLWEEPMNQLISEILTVVIHVTSKLSELLFLQYPKLQDTIKILVEKVIEESKKKCIAKLMDIFEREKDPFTLNDFLQQWVNKLRYDRFAKAVEESFEESKNLPNNWIGLKEEIYNSLRQWYRSTHAISPHASAQEMAAIMEAYWNLSAKRFIDNCCMISDKELLNTLPELIQDAMYGLIKDDQRLQALFVMNSDLLIQKEQVELRKEQLILATTKLNSIH